MDEFRSQSEREVAYFGRRVTLIDELADRYKKREA